MYDFNVNNLNMNVFKCIVTEQCPTTGNTTVLKTVPIVNKLYHNTYSLGYLHAQNTPWYPEYNWLTQQSISAYTNISQAEHWLAALRCHKVESTHIISLIYRGTLSPEIHIKYLILIKRWILKDGKDGY